MITSEKLRVSFQLIRFADEHLSKASRVDLEDIRRFELKTAFSSGNPRTVEVLQKALEKAGIEFIGTPDDRPGVRLK
jgi:pyridoxine/pyridoxamine 5'-phosphate oxidase